MTVSAINIGRPFFDITLIEDEATFAVRGSAIVLNLSQSPLRLEQQQLSSLQSAIVRRTALRAVPFAVRATAAVQLAIGDCAPDGTARGQLGGGD